ncbi:hypothetical protein FBUS_01497 [Fasciolopsis buskii]|uniref:Uncharacterized protein n=1 Tax=Fasciolopsis buskii TaxID=27845 RepID=A0A8E0S1K5_9TREM|nr:hypothetical protein FBUS_01497 [Fasciolopsis buski]
MSRSYTNLTQYGRSPYDTCCIGLVPKQTVQLFNSHAPWATCDDAAQKLEMERVHYYNERRRLNASIPREEELSSFLYMQQLNLTRRLGKFIKEHNRAITKAIGDLQITGRMAF